MTLFFMRLFRVVKRYVVVGKTRLCDAYLNILDSNVLPENCQFCLAISSNRKTYGATVSNENGLIIVCSFRRSSLDPVRQIRPACQDGDVWRLLSFGASLLSLKMVRGLFLWDRLARSLDVFCGCETPKAAHVAQIRFI
jgi:hypothetical protein